LLEELDDLLEFFLRFVDARDVLERHFLLRAGRQLRTALAERQGLVPAALHLPHDEEPEADHQQDRRPRVQQRRPRARGLGLRDDRDVAIRELVAQALVLRRRIGAEPRAAVATGRQSQFAGDLVARNDYRLDLTLVQILQELRERHWGFPGLVDGGEIPD